MKRSALFFIISLIISGFFFTGSAQAGAGDNVSGYAWSENIGWVSFNCTNQGTCGIINYGVNINSSTGKFSGYAWSENIGWIDFGPASPYPASPNYSACLDFPSSGQTCDGLGTNKVGGWARALSYGGGWDGWIKLRGSNYGVDYTPQSGELSGWAWSDMVIGWTSFKGANYVVVTTAKLPPSVSTAGDGETWDHCSYKGKSIPILNWNYSDGTQAAYWVQIDNTAASFPSPEVDTGEILSSSQSYAATLYNFNWNTNYWWRVKVKNQQGVWSGWSNVDNFNTPQHAYPWPDFTHQPQTPAAGEEISFIDSSTCYDSGESPYFCKTNTGNRYQWDFEDDGQIDCDSNINSACRGDVTHIYPTAGDYTTRLYVTDDAGTCDTTGDTPITTQLPLPEYKEVPPIIWLKKILAAVVDFFDGFSKF